MVWYVSNYSSFVGWTGDRCDQISAQNVIYFLMLMLLSVWCFSLIIVNGRTLLLHMEHLFSIGKKYDPLVSTAMYMIVSALCILIHSVGTSRGVLDPTEFEIVVYPTLDGNQVEDVTVTNGKFLGYLLLIAGSAFALASLQIFASWQTIAIIGARFGAKRTKILATSTLNFIRGFICVFVISLFSFIFLDQLALSVILFICVTLFLAVGYPLAYLMLRSTFVGMRVEGNDYVQELVNLIKFCCKVNASCLLFSGICLILFYPLLILEDTVLVPGRYNFVVLFRDLGVMSGLLQSSVMSWYLITVATRERTLVKTSERVWKTWDKGHEKVVKYETTQESSLKV